MSGLPSMGRDKHRFQTTCLICGRDYEYLAAHIFRAHGMRAIEYRKEFSLDRHDVLISEELSDRRSVIHHNQLARQREEYRDKMKSAFTGMLSRRKRRERAAETCHAGHPYDEANLRWDGTRRSCRICDARRQREYKRRKAGG